MERYTEYHEGKAVIRDKSLLPEAMAKLAKYEDEEEKKAPSWKEAVMRTFLGGR